MPLEPLFRYVFLTMMSPTVPMLPGRPGVCEQAYKHALIPISHQRPFVRAEQRQSCTIGCPARHVVVSMLFKCIRSLVVPVVLTYRELWLFLISFKCKFHLGRVIC